MDKRVKKLWVDALRSGQYKQGKHQLRFKDEFCCLGVLCNLHAIEHPEFAGEQHSSNLYGGHSASLPVEVVDWAGLSSQSPAAGDCELATHNDNGKSFQQIANLIQRHL